jgi:uncharacterized protein Yka (UPF0111/DUF47 family)
MEWLKNPDWIMAVTEALIPLVGVVYWLARLEGKVRDHSKEIDKMETKNDNMFEKLFDKLSGIEVGIAELKGKWSATDKLK